MEEWGATVGLFLVLLWALGTCSPAAEKQQEARRRRRAGHGGYAKDGSRVFFEGERVENASARSFEVLSDGWAKDGSRVFFDGERVENASAYSFQVLGGGREPAQSTAALRRRPHRSPARTRR